MASSSASMAAQSMNPPHANVFFNNMMAQSVPGPQSLLNVQQQMPSAFNPLPPGLGMGGLNPLFMQILEDAMKYNAPVGTYDDDQALLVDALLASTKAGVSPREALEALHGRNNHSSSLWKDYYLEHTSHIDRLVAAKGVDKPAGIKRPSFSWEKAGKSSTSKAGSSGNRPLLAVRSGAHPPEAKRQRLSDSARPRANNVPAVSRSPTPPTEIVMHANGKVFYTPDERDYFFNFVRRRLTKDPSRSRTELCRELEEKMPQHTAASWSAHWRRCETKGWDPHSGKVVDDFNNAKDKLVDPCPPKDRRKSQGDIVIKPEPMDDAFDLRGAASEDDGPNPKRKRVLVRFTDEDMSDIVKYVGSFSVVEWARLNTAERWKTFAETHHSGRSIQAWSTAYRRRENIIDSKAQKYRKTHTKARTSA